MESIGLNIDKNLENNRDFGYTILQAQKSFLESDIGKAVNTAIDLGIKAALPDIIENQVINIKDAIMRQGLKEGIKEIINSGIDIGKSALGIVTGNFESISQIELAVKKGGIIDGISNLLDTAIKLAKSKNLINSTTANIIKQSKNSIMNSISSKIEESLTNQIKSIEKLESYCEKWNEAFENKDFSTMEKRYKNINNYLNKTIPLEKIINQARKIENIHNLIRNNGHNFNITDNELKLAEKLN